MEKFSTPILMLVFNRPDTAVQVFNRIREIKPAKLYIAADGPRTPSEHERCSAVREIVQKIDWECTPKFLLRDVNLGCYNAVTSAIDWLFEHEDSGIILEDDCLPDLSFFPYCRDLLEQYKDNDRVMMISGTNFNIVSGENSYYFSKYGLIWGWATWKKSWDLFERKMLSDETDIDFYTAKEKKFWLKFSDVVWDVQWAVYSMRKHDGLAVMPNVNLVENIGFGQDATHYTDANSKVANMKTDAMKFPLNHPSEVFCDKKTDMRFFNNYYYHCLWHRIFRALIRILRAFISKLYNV
jgi:hypothetical protein